jgi:hypothetical protein
MTDSIVFLVGCFATLLCVVATVILAMRLKQMLKTESPMRLARTKVF